MNFNWKGWAGGVGMLFIAACSTPAIDRVTAAQASLTPVFQATIIARERGLISDSEWHQLMSYAITLNERLMQWRLDPDSDDLEEAYLAALSLYNSFKAEAVQ